MAGTSSNLIVIDCMSLPEISLSSIKVVKAKEIYRYAQISDSDVFEELSSESVSEDTSELTCKKNLFYDVRWEMVIEYCNNA